VTPTRDLIDPYLRRRSRRGFRGYPAATVAYYGPDDARATKVAVALVVSERAEPSEPRMWTVEEGDARVDPFVRAAVVDCVRAARAVSVVVADGILGCPHEEGADYPEGGSCPECPFWVGRERWSGALVE
jgi:hypothetical protein